MNLRLLALGGVVGCAVALPLAVAFAGPAGDEGRAVGRAQPSAGREKSPAEDAAVDAVVGPASRAEDAQASPADWARSPLLAGPGLATAARCGPELTSPDGIEAQTCVLTQGEDTWARTYFRNATGRALDSVLSLMGPGGRTIQMRCPVGADDEPGTCETPRERTRGLLGSYTAVAEFAWVSARDGQGPLLLRSGSNSEGPTGS